MPERKRAVGRVERPFRYEVGELGSGEIIDVPAGFKTDFASIPKFLWSFLTPLGLYLKAAVLHDYIVRFRSDKYSHWRASKIFLEAMRVLGVNRVTAYPMYAAVLALGWRNRGKEASYGEQ